MDFCYIPPGSFWLGSDDVKDAPPHLVDLPYAYWLSKYPVTRRQFMGFVADGGYEHEPYWVEAALGGTWTDGHVHYHKEENYRSQPVDLGDHFQQDNFPVVGISLYEATAYCRWLSDRWYRHLPRTHCFRLPTEAEWEKAARGGLQIPVRHQRTSEEGLYLKVFTDIEMMDNPMPQRPYPWGTKLTPLIAAYGDEHDLLTNVDYFPDNISPYGCVGMAGNVGEWTRSDKEDYPYELGQYRDNPNLAFTYWMSYRGGGIYDEAHELHLSYRAFYWPYHESLNLGFRMAVAPIIE